MFFLPPPQNLGLVFKGQLLAFPQDHKTKGQTFRGQLNQADRPTGPGHLKKSPPAPFPLSRKDTKRKKNRLVSEACADRGLAVCLLEERHELAPRLGDFFLKGHGSGRKVRKGEEWALDRSKSSDRREAHLTFWSSSGGCKKAWRNKLGSWFTALPVLCCCAWSTVMLSNRQNHRRRPTLGKPCEET